MKNIKIKAGSNGQFLVRYKDSEEAEKICEWLEDRGYYNSHVEKFDGTTPQVIVVDESGSFFGTNTTCMAAAASCGVEFIDFNKLRALESKFEIRFIVYSRYNQRWTCLEKYACAIRRYLIVCPYHYTKEGADELIAHHWGQIEETYKDGTDIEHAALEIGHRRG